MDQFDAIVVGSGISGGWAAKELTEKGLKVLMIERGPMVIHGKDYVGEHKAPWEFPFGGFGDRKLYNAEYPVQQLCYAFEEASQQFFVNDKEHPYQTPEGKPFAWIRGYHLGGRSLMWGRASFRMADINFTENARDGHGVDWPIRYSDIAPWYDHVERFVGIAGSKEGLEVLPDGQFIPALPMNCVEEHVAKSIKAGFPGRTMIQERAAVLTEDRPGRSPCHFCGPCHRGCSVGAYFSTLSSTLPAAQATGNLTLITDSIVTSVEYDPKSKRATGIRTIDAKSGARKTYQARIIFLNASTLGTTQILLQSKSAAFPNGFANSSGAVGHYLMDQVMGPAVTGEIPGFLDRQPYGVKPNGVYIPRFRNVGKRDTNFLRGYGYQGAASRAPWMRGMELAEMGIQLKKSLRKPGAWTVFIGGMGECLPYYSNQVTLDIHKVDKWGLPQLNISFDWGENEKKMALDMAQEGAAMLKAAGAVNIKAKSDLVQGGLAIHEMGTARMGRDPKTSVLNKYNQCHDAANVFITDGSCMTSIPFQNPSLTYMALTARAANYAVDQMKAGVI